MQAQSLFEANSNIIRSITDQLQLIKTLGDRDTAARLQAKFDQILDLSSNDQLEVLLEEIQSHIPSIEEI